MSGISTEDVFSGLPRDARVVPYLESALAGGKVTHAYLIVGDADSGKEQIARRFAAALLAPDDEEQFWQACRGKHPDLRELEPGGAAGYLVEQVRDIVHDAELAPIRAMRKVYLVTRAETLRGGPANAFLKTLEEPPADVVCILLATSAGSVLETLKSRCEVLVLNGSTAHAQAGADVLSLVYPVATGCDNRQLLFSARRFVELASGEAEEEEARLGRRLEDQREFLSATAAREIEKTNKRRVSTCLRAALDGQLASVRSWLRDCLMVQQGAPELASHPQGTVQTLDVASSAAPSGIVSALAAVDACAQRISYNVTPQLAVEAMFMEIREALCQQ